ncbi:variant erythrocyte surface antigen-1 beta subunit [Babesia bovis T2Bo]|uniref:variant erythrocyte surface antigen-1 beta subunit n=1 Tax=Babesia bovis T2Bo TaxID=484906 RepID=UPI001C347EC1|nr:variant erythrocyte surface antigen-1 beta subunit [Babesia bovis T2Bo]EDO08169.2 variant erythrocyte surface antigen-1 beta subunit [Babesia bovis T2Bo]
MAASITFTPKASLTDAPTNLKEAIDWVLRVTGKDGKKNVAAKQSPPASTSNGPHCLCYLAKAVKDLLYDARCPGSPGPSPKRNWDDILLLEEQSIVNPVLEDLGLLSGESGTVSTTFTNAGGTEVIRTLIDQLALGLQKWVGWQEGEVDKCCLKGTEGIGKKCDCQGGGGGGNCCSTGVPSTPCHQCSTCGTSATGHKCYQSAYCKKTGSSGAPSSPPEGQYYWPTLSSDSTKVHLLARIFLGSVCLIWSGLSQLGFLTAKGTGGTERWREKTLTSESAGLGSFMAAMGYDLDRLNKGKGGAFLQELLKGDKPDKNVIKWQEFKNGNASSKSVAEYYSSIYSTAQSAAKDKSTEDICKEYPLLVLHILASGYFRAGSAGANKVTPAKPATSDTKKETPSLRKPRTIREILYWLSALPYSQGYKALVERMQGKMESDTLTLEGTTSGGSTTLKKDCITHYLLAACGYCPLVLIGIQGTIEKEVTNTGSAATGAGGVAAGADKRCKQHKEDRNHRCDPKNIKEHASDTSGQSSASSANGELQAGQVCYGGYHLEVSSFGPLHGMYANGLYGFDMDLSAAQCLDQLRVYVYHCFYQLYFLRKQCGAGAIAAVGGGGSSVVLGWKSCRYGSGVGTTSTTRWICQGTGSNGNDHSKNCGLQNAAGSGTGSGSPLMAFLCDTVTGLHCGMTTGKDLNSGKQDYPSIEDHLEAKETSPLGHFGKPPMHCPVPMGWSKDVTGSGANRVNHFKDLKDTHKTGTLTGVGQSPGTYPVHCTGNTLSYLLEYYCDPVHCQGTLVVLLRLLACITPTVPRTLGDLFGFYYYIVYIGGFQSWDFKPNGLWHLMKGELNQVSLNMGSSSGDKVIKALDKFSGVSVDSADIHSTVIDVSLRTLYSTNNGPYLCPLSGQQYGQLSPAMAGTYLSWLVYLIEGFEEGLDKLKEEFTKVDCRNDGCKNGPGRSAGCSDSGECQKGSHGDPCPSGGGSGGANQGVCGCASVVSCTGVLPVLYRYGFGYGDVKALHKDGGDSKKCHDFLTTLTKVLNGDHLKKEGATSGLHYEINKLIYTTRLPWIFVLTLAWLVAVVYLAFGAIWPLDWTHMRSHCRGWFRKGSLSPWEVLMVGKKKGRGILEFFGGK